MIICVCHGVCERRLEMVVSAGATTPEAVEQQCGAGGDCGACRDDVERVIDCVVSRLGVGGPRTASQPPDRPTTHLAAPNVTRPVAAPTDAARVVAAPADAARVVAAPDRAA